MINSYDLKLIRKWALIGLALSAISGFLIPQPVFIYKVINGLFAGGVTCLAMGGFGFAAYLGGFDLFKYTHKKLGQYSKKNEDNPDKQKVGTYYDYMEKKQRSKRFFIPLGVGLAYFAASVILTIFFA